MKKIYMLVAGLVIGGTIISQNVLQTPVHAKLKATLSPNAKIPVNHSDASPRSGTFAVWIEPILNVMLTGGIDTSGAATGTSQSSHYIDVIYQDSTVTLSSTNGTRSVSDMMLGTVLDPKSDYLTNFATPYVTAADSYYLDSIGIIGSYAQVTSAVDTLYTWIVWGDTTNSSFGFTKKTAASLWVPPLSTFRYEVEGPKLIGATAAPGNKMKSAVPSSHMKLFKHVLQGSDVTGSGISTFINIALDSSLYIPPGNIVSCYYEFVPGGTYVAGDCSYAFTGAPATQTVNGFAGGIWNQTSPVVNAVTDYQPQQIDPDGFNMGLTYFKQLRHAQTGFTSRDTYLWGDFTTGPQIYYFISSSPTNSGVSELTNNNFSLLQNQPNPFTNQTTIKYQLKKSASDVAVQIVDIRGVKMFEKTEKNLKPGNYSLNVNDINFAAGVYFCTLTVDGAKVTNKIIKQ